MNLDGSVRADDKAGEGTATVVLSFENWKGAKVQPTTHAISVLPAKPGPKTEAVSPYLVASLVHPERKASISQLRYTDDGKQLFSAGYPSGVVQFWDLETRKELRRIETPKGYRGQMEYALLTPDWKTLYVPDENKRKVVPVEVDGKKDHRIEYSGYVLAWDAQTGQPKDGLAPEKECGAGYSVLSPDGNWMIVVEYKTGLASERNGGNPTTWLWNLKSGKKTKLFVGFSISKFLPDRKTLSISMTDFEAKKSTIQRIDLASGEVLANRILSEDSFFFSISDVSPDGKLMAVSKGGKVGTVPTTLFLDATTFKDLDVMKGEVRLDRYGWNVCKFTPDGSAYLTNGMSGSIRVWDVAKKKVIRKLPLSDPSYVMEVSPNGNWLAVAWMPKPDEVEEGTREPDPRDLPQPRVTLYHLKDETIKPITLMAPHGYVGKLVFRPDGKQLAFGSAGSIHLFDISEITK